MQTPIFYALAVVLVIGTAIPVFKGINSVSKVCNKVVPVMALGYTAVVCILLILNIGKLPAFFSAFLYRLQPARLFRAVPLEPLSHRV